MIKTGIDIVKISRIKESITNVCFLREVYTNNEIEYCRRDESFAGIFAAKEAYFKALGTGLKFPLSNIEILHDEKGKPYFNGIKNCDVSISHDGEYAIAVVVLEA